jgi:hypothetical protein
MEPIRVRNHMWEATLESGGLDVLDVPTLYRASLFGTFRRPCCFRTWSRAVMSSTILRPAS